MKEMFDIIVEYPDSEIALQELKSCLESQPAWRRKLIDSTVAGYVKLLDDTTNLNHSINRRLLHPGAKTSDIIEQYIGTIKSLLVLDSTGTVLEVVAEPIREYLRKRSDTVRCIINKLFDADNESLAEELKRTEPISLSPDDEDEECSLDWVPLSRDMGKEIRALKNTRDILNTLVNIYDSVDVFTKEFQSFLAQRLLSLDNYDHENEVRHRIRIDN